MPMIDMDHEQVESNNESAFEDEPASDWQAEVEEQLHIEPPERWAERLLSYAEELADVEPEMALVMRVCAVVIERSPVYTAHDLHMAAESVRNQAIEDCQLIAQAFEDKGSRLESLGATTVGRHLSSIPLPGLPEPRMPPTEPQARQNDPAPAAPRTGPSHEEQALRQEIEQLRLIISKLEQKARAQPDQPAHHANEATMRKPVNRDPPPIRTFAAEPPASLAARPQAAEPVRQDALHSRESSSTTHQIDPGWPELGRPELGRPELGRPELGRQRQLLLESVKKRGKPQPAAIGLAVVDDLYSDILARRNSTATRV